MILPRPDPNAQHHHQYYFDLATDFEDEGRFDDALEAYTESVAYVPAQADVHYNRAILLDKLGRFDESVAASGENSTWSLGLG